MKYIFSTAAALALCAPLMAQHVETGESVTTLPYVNHFYQKEFNQFGIYDANQDNCSFWLSDHHATYNTSSNGYQAADDWFISPLIYLESGKEYYYRFNCSGWCNGSVEMLLGTDTDISTMTTVLAQTTDYYYDGLNYATFTVPASGYYSLGMHLQYGGGDWWYIDIDDFVVDTTYDSEQAFAIGDFYNYGPVEEGSRVGHFETYVSRWTESGSYIGDDVEVSINFNNLMTISARPDEWVSFDCEIPTDGHQQFWLTVSRDGNHGPVYHTGQCFYGNDIPTAPENLFATITDASHIQFSWDEVSTTGQNGYNVIPSEVTYSIWKVNKQSNQPVEKISPEVSGTSWIYEADFDEGEQDFYRFAVLASNSAGTSGMSNTCEVLLGAPYAFPYHEDFYMESNSPHKFSFVKIDGYDYIPGIGYWDSSDGDGRAIESWQGASGPYSYLLDLGKVSLQDANNAVLRFASRYSIYYRTVTVLLQTASGGWYDWTPVSLGESWQNFEFDLSPYVGEKWVHIQLRIDQENDYGYFYLDNVNVIDPTVENHFFNFRPDSRDVYAGENTYANVYVYNLGNTDYANYSLNLYADNQLIYTMPDVPQVPAKETRNAGFYYSLPSDATTHRADLRMEMVDHTTGITTVINDTTFVRETECYAPYNLEVSFSNGIYLYWSRPDYQRHSGYNLYIDGTKVATIPKENNGYTYTGGGLTEGEHLVELTAAYGSKESSAISGYVTIAYDAPYSPNYITAKVIDDMHVQFDWNPSPASGPNGNYVDTDAVTYTVWSVDRATGSLIEQISPELVGTTSWTYELDINSLPQTYYRYTVLASNSYGSADNYSAVCEVVMGAPYSLPYHEGFRAGSNMQHAYYYTSVENDNPGVGFTWNDSDGDGRCIQSYLSWSQHNYYLSMGKVSMKNIQNPVLSFDSYTDYYGVTLTPLVVTASRDTVQLEEMAVPAGEGWFHGLYDLSNWVGQDYVEIIFRIFNEDWCYFHLDNVAIYNVAEENLLVDYFCEYTSLTAGESAWVYPYIYNFTQSENINYSLSLYGNDQMQQTQTYENEVSIGRCVQQSMRLTVPSDLENEIMKVRIDVTNNHTGAITSAAGSIFVFGTELFVPNYLSASESLQGINITWDNPDYGRHSGFNVYLDGVKLATVGKDIHSYLFNDALANGDHTIGVSALYGSKESEISAVILTTSLGENTVAPAAIELARVMEGEGSKNRLSFMAPTLNAEGGDFAYGTTISLDINGSANVATVRAGEAVVYYANATSFEITPHAGNLYGESVTVNLESSTFQPQNYTLRYWNGPSEFEGETTISVNNPDQIITTRVPWHNFYNYQHNLQFALQDADARQLSTYSYNIWEDLGEPTTGATIEEIRYDVNGWEGESLQLNGATSVDHTFHVDMRLSEFPTYWEDYLNIDIWEQNEDYDVLRAWFNEGRNFNLSFRQGSGNWINRSVYLDVENARLITAGDVPYNSVAHLNYDELSGISAKRIFARNYWSDRSIAFRTNEAIYGKLWNRYYGNVNSADWLYETHYVELPEASESEWGKYYLLMNSTGYRWAEESGPKLTMVSNPLPETLPIYEQGTVADLMSMVDAGSIRTLHLGGVVNESDLEYIRNYMGGLRTLSLHKDQTYLPDGMFNWMGNLLTLNWNTPHIPIESKYFNSPENMRNLMVYAPSSASSAPALTRTMGAAAPQMPSSMKLASDGTAKAAAARLLTPASARQEKTANYAARMARPQVAAETRAQAPAKNAEVVELYATEYAVNWEYYYESKDWYCAVNAGAYVLRLDVFSDDANSPIGVYGSADFDYNYTWGSKDDVQITFESANATVSQGVDGYYVDATVVTSEGETLHLVVNPGGNTNPSDEYTYVSTNATLGDFTADLGAVQISAYTDDGSGNWISFVFDISSVQPGHYTQLSQEYADYCNIAFGSEGYAMTSCDVYLELYSDSFRLYGSFIAAGTLYYADLTGPYNGNPDPNPNQGDVNDDPDNDIYEVFYADQINEATIYDGNYAFIRANDGTRMFATLIFVNGNALPSGRYYINESYSSGSVLAGGIDGGSVYPTFYGTLSEDGFINIPLWLFRSGYVDVSYNEYNELTLDVNGTNSWGRSGRVILFCGNVFGSGYDPGYNPGDDPNYDPDNDPWADFDPTITYRGNVIKDGRAPVITLYDKSPVNIPQGFYADSVRFSRWFNEDMLSSRNGRAGGWVGLVLPFSVQHIYSDWKGELAPFGAASANQRPFWVAHQNYSAQGYELSSSIEANRPYIVCMPNDPDQYDPEYNIYGNVTFSARNAWMNNTYESWTEGLNYNLHSAYDYVPKSEDVYALNTTNTASYYAGGAFVSNLRNVEPFEVYARSNSYARPPYYAIGGEDDTVGIEQILGQSISAAGLSLRCYSMAGDLYIVSSANLDEALPIYALNGQIVKEVAVKAGTTTVKGLASGIYVIGGQKVPVFGQAK